MVERFCVKLILVELGFVDFLFKDVMVRVD